MVNLYQIENTVNGKLYFGKTIKTVAQRWASHQCAAKAGAQLALSRAIRKHGPESFVITLLFAVATEEAANICERFLIARYKTHSKGYNLTMGGDGISDPTPELLVRRKAAQHAAMRRPGVTRSRTRFGYGRISPHYRADVSTQEIIGLYAAGLGLRTVGKRVGMGFAGVERRLKAAGVKLRTHAEATRGARNG